MESGSSTVPVQMLEFFFLQDQKQPLSITLEKWPTWYSRGTTGVRCGTNPERIAKLAVALAPITGANPQDAAKKAALLAKCDSTSELVGEFPELQGIAGTYYALS